MIASRADLARYRDLDARAHGIGLWTWRNQVSARSADRIMRFQRRLRLIEYLTNCRPRGSRWTLAVVWRIHMRNAERMGFTVPPNTFGPGLCLVHYGTIVINDRARVGADARVHPSSSLGRDEAGAPQLGDGCFVGPGARIIGAITLGSHVIVGANAVVTHSFPDHAVLAGIPARQIGTRPTRSNIH